MRKSLKRTCRPPAWVFHHIVSPSTRMVFKTLGLPHQDGYFPKTQEMIGVWPWYCHHIVINTVNFRLNTFGHRHGPRFGVYPQQQTFKQDENFPKRMSSKHGCAIVGVLRSKHIWLLRLSSCPCLSCLSCLVQQLDQFRQRPKSPYSKNFSQQSAWMHDTITTGSTWNSSSWSMPFPIGSMYAICGNMDPINIPQSC